MAQKTCCPTCGAPIAENAPVHIDIEAGIVVGRGRFAALTPQEMDLLILLRERYPRTVSKEAACNALYLHEGDRAEEKIIDVYVCKIRKKIAGTGMGIQTMWGRGHRLCYEGENEHAAA